MNLNSHSRNIETPNSRNSTPERVLLAAILTTDGKIHQAGDVSRGHSDIREISKYQEAEDYIPYRKGEIEGFVTSSGRFVSRREAAEIAFKAGQTATDVVNLKSAHLQ